MPETPPEPVAYRYTGVCGQWCPCVPPRDLTASEVAALDPTAWAEALASGIYETVDNAPAEGEEG